MKEDNKMVFLEKPQFYSDKVLDKIDEWERSRSENDSRFYPRLERTERKLDAIIRWINFFARNNAFIGSKNGWNIEGKFGNLPIINVENCEVRNRDSKQA